MWALRPTTAPPLMGEPELDVEPGSNMEYKGRRHVREGHCISSSNNIRDKMCGKMKRPRNAREVKQETNRQCKRSTSLKCKR